MNLRLDGKKVVVFLFWIVALTIMFVIFTLWKGVTIASCSLLLVWAMKSLLQDAYLKRDEGAFVSLLAWIGYTGTVVVSNAGENWNRTLYWVLLGIGAALVVASIIFGRLNDITALFPLDTRRAAKVAGVRPPPIQLDSKMGFQTPFMDEVLWITEVVQGLIQVILFEVVWTGKIWWVAMITNWLSPKLLEVVAEIQNLIITGLGK